MTNLLSEQRIGLADLAKREGVHTRTIWRWARQGVSGVVLETFTVGGRRFTTLEAFVRWVIRINHEPVHTEL